MPRHAHKRQLCRQDLPFTRCAMELWVDQWSRGSGRPGIDTRERARGPFAEVAVGGTGAWSRGEGMSGDAARPVPAQDAGVPVR